MLVNDSSPDDSLTIAVNLARSDAHLVVVDLSRNFGHHKAMMTGLVHARGERVFLLDSDLEEEPEWLLPFAAQQQRDGCEVVYGVKLSRKGSLFERITGQWFYSIFNALSGLRLPANIVVARLMTRRYVDALVQHDEREIFMAGLWHITGFNQQPQTVTKHSTSKSTYSLRHKIAMLVNSVTAFSNAPLHVIFYVGATISALAGIGILYILFHWLFLARPVGGWTSVMASIWLLGGLIISFYRRYRHLSGQDIFETKRRPYTIVREVYRAGKPQPRRPDCSAWEGQQ